MPWRSSNDKEFSSTLITMLINGLEWKCRDCQNFRYAMADTVNHVQQGDDSVVAGHGMYQSCIAWWPWQALSMSVLPPCLRPGQWWLALCVQPGCVNCAVYSIPWTFLMLPWEYVLHEIATDYYATASQLSWLACTLQCTVWDEYTTCISWGTLYHF